MRDETPQFYIEAKELQARNRVPAPDGLIKTGAVAGTGIGFCGAVLYLICWLLFQLAVASAGSTNPALLPSTAQWVTAMLLFLAYGMIGSIILGALAGTVAAALIRSSWGSQTPVLAWLFGTITGFVITLLITLMMNGLGYDVDLAKRLRELTFPSMVFAIEGGLIGLWVYRDGIRKDSAAAAESGTRENSETQQQRSS
jgi:uncharacterized membrane protein YeaQ/YmgE (transglycosylase-associated protein family)